MTTTNETPALPPQAVDELLEIIFELVRIVPNPIVKRQIAIMRPNLRVAFEDNSKKISEDVLGPLHAFCHQYEIPVLDKRASSVKEGLEMQEAKK